MPSKIIKIAKSIEITGNISDFICAKINRIKMIDITTTDEFTVSVDGRNVTVKNNNKKALDKFCKELTRLIKGGGNRLNKMLK